MEDRQLSHERPVPGARYRLVAVSVMLRRAASFSRQRKPPPAPSAKQARSTTEDACEKPASPSSPTSAFSDEDLKTKPCQALRGWLKKRHTSQKRVAPQWGSRYVYVDESTGVLAYAKSASQFAARRANVHLSDVTAVELAGAERSDLPAHAFIVRCDIRAGEVGRASDLRELVFAAEDKEEAAMWIAQLRARLARLAQSRDGRSGPEGPLARRIYSREIAAPAEPAPPELLSDEEDDDDTATVSGRSIALAPAAHVPTPASATIAGMGGGAGGATSIALAQLRADFAAEHECELGCAMGEILLPMPWLPAPPGWTFAARPTGGAHGLVPTEYLQMLDAVASLPLACPSACQPPSGYSSAAGALPAPTAQAQQPAISAAAPPSAADDGAGVFEPSVDVVDDRATSSIESERKLQISTATLGARPPASPGTKRKQPPSPPSSVEPTSPLEAPHGDLGSSMYDPMQAEGEAAVRETQRGQADDGMIPCAGVDNEAHDAEAVDAETHDAEAREAEALDAETRDAEARDAEARDAEACEAEACEAEAHEIEAREAEAREIEAREAEAREIEAREAEAREIEARMSSEAAVAEHDEPMAPASPLGPIVAENNGVAICADADFAEGDWDETEHPPTCNETEGEDGACIVAENNGVAIVADTGFVDADWDDDEEE